MAEITLCRHCGHELDRFKHKIIGIVWFGHFIGISQTIYLHWIVMDKESALVCHCGCAHPEPAKVKH